MDDNTWLLVDDQEIMIFINNVYRDRFRLYIRAGWLGYRDLKILAAIKVITCFLDNFTIYPNRAIANELLHLRAGEIRHVFHYYDV
jgi:hypothetical protein